jgi:hypothetical protein
VLRAISGVSSTLPYTFALNACAKRIWRLLVPENFDTKLA